MEAKSITRVGAGLLLTAILAGCSSVFSSPATEPPKLNGYIVSVSFDVSKCPKGADACATWIGGVCRLHLPRDRWSKCAVHELGHCFNGHWHHNKPTPCQI